jgi:hypothetical protein
LSQAPKRNFITPLSTRRVFKRFHVTGVFVVTEEDLRRMAERFRVAEDYVMRVRWMVWERNPLETRALEFQRLSSEP